MTVLYTKRLRNFSCEIILFWILKVFAFEGEVCRAASINVLWKNFEYKITPFLILFNKQNMYKRPKWVFVKIWDLQKHKKKKTIYSNYINAFGILQHASDCKRKIVLKKYNPTLLCINYYDIIYFKIDSNVSFYDVRCR